MDKPDTAVGATIIELYDATFAKEVLEAETPVLIDFMAEWCGPCKVMAPIFAQLAPEYSGRVKFAKLDADYNPDTVGTLGVTNLPTFMLLYRDTVLASGIGTMRPAALRSWIDQALTRMDTLPSSAR
jgi:thioredoxin 1